MESTPPLPQRPGLLASAQAVAGALVALACTRLQLAGTELEEERLRLTELVVWGVAALFFIGLGIVFGGLLLVLLLWNGPRELALGALAFGFLAAGGWAVRTCQRKARDKPPLLAATIEELRRDAAALERLRP